MVLPNDEFECSMILSTFNEARKKHAPIRGAHEGYAVILEELDEMWAEIKKDDIEAARHECYQVAAMCLAFLLEVK